jgi:hypothetical protein
MKDKNPLVDKSYAFALRVVKLYRYLCGEQKEFVLSKQVLDERLRIAGSILVSLKTGQAAH